MNKKNKIIGSVIIVLIFCVFTLVGYLKDNKEESYEDMFVESKPAVSANANLNITVKDIRVEIKGEVKRPGVYTMEAGSRLEDLIKKAEGLTADADKERLMSLAKKLKDEECIVIPNRNTPKESINLNNESSNDNKSEDIININTADKEDLDKIPGVGPVTAQKILDYREEKGYFNSIEDIKNIAGIGDKTLEKIKDKITVE